MSTTPGNEPDTNPDAGEESTTETPGSDGSETPPDNPSGQSGRSGINELQGDDVASGGS